jgi:DNA-directed RNA polymerase subunit E'/Rpb7
MEYTAVFEEQVALTPRDIRGKIESIDTVLEGKLRTRLEGKCSRNGFVLSDSIKILSRSMGALERGRFSGHLLFHVQAEGRVLNPPDKTILEGEVIRKNKMGLYVNYRDAIRVIVPRDATVGTADSDEFESVEIGETVTVEIKKSRFQVNDEYILSVGLFMGRKGEPKVTKPKKQEKEEEELSIPDEEAEEAEEAEAVSLPVPVPLATTTLPVQAAGKRRYNFKQK